MSVWYSSIYKIYDYIESHIDIRCIVPKTKLLPVRKQAFSADGFKENEKCRWKKKYHIQTVKPLSGVTCRI